MNNKTKVVNIYPSFPITTIKPAIYSSVKNVTKSTDEIRACIMAKARVEEVIDNKTIIKLDLSNYDRDNKVNDITPEFVQEENVSINNEQPTDENNEESQSSIDDEVIENTVELESEEDENEEISEDDKYGL